MTDQAAAKKGYWILHVNVTDPDAYQEYLRLDAIAFANFDAKPVVRGGRYWAPEDDQPPRHIVLEFADYDTAIACYNSDAYQKALPHRLAASVSSIVIVEGA